MICHTFEWFVWPDINKFRSWLKYFNTDSFFNKSNDSISSLPLRISSLIEWKDDVWRKIMHPYCNNWEKQSKLKRYCFHGEI